MDTYTTTAVAQGADQAIEQTAMAIEKVSTAVSKGNQIAAMAVGAGGAILAVALVYGGYKLGKKLINNWQEKKNQPPVQTDQTTAGTK
jgi:phage tail tape-measure protein